VTIEGKPAVGRLLLTPVGTGKQSNSIIAADGAFHLYTDAEEGANPGTYHALIKVDPERLIANGAGDAETDGGRTLIYESPRQDPVVIPDAGADEMLIEISPEGGWTKNWSD
jgi:hypothetical protein